MTLLFDTSPQEEPKKKRGKKPRVIVEPEPPAPALPRRPPVATILGRDDETVCLDQTCQAACNDITDDDRGWLRLECCFCGTGQWVKGRLPEKPAGNVFRLRGGRFDGMTLDEVFEAPRGRDYLEWAEKEHPRDIVRNAVAAWRAAR